MIGYEDPAAAIEWLREAFGFEEDESERHTEPDGRITHAQLSLGEATIMLANPTPEYARRRRIGRSAIRPRACTTTHG